MRVVDIPLEQVLEHFAGRVGVDDSAADMRCLLVMPTDLVALCTLLRDEAALRFTFLSDICGVDYFPDTPRFLLVYHLYSIPHKMRLRIKCQLEDPPVAPTLTPVWTTANWHEREAYDMYGIRFDGHPDLRRIYMWEGFDGYPMRRDFPLRGYKDDYNPMGAERPVEGSGS
ncbi:MAG: NADH-quinone oxidoreductase subunit C [Rhodobacteraceae bacterium]|nr:MAG: NADH-quinone oxidoreductase subunit C [Paracoccaceae bacterium]